MTRKYLLSLSLFAIVAAASAAPKKDIVGTAVEADGFKTLVAAVKAAGLVDTLTGEGPFTVFAPTDEAFAKLPKGTLESLLKPENKDQLVFILTYHVLEGKVKSKKAAKLVVAKSVSGKELKITKDDDGLMINDSKVVKANIKTSNGIIHVIDQVLLPEPIQTAKSTDKTHEILTHAIHVGVPLFNSGHHHMTAKIYMFAGHKALNQCSSSACPEASKTLSDALKRASSVHSSTSRAWIMRRAFDHVLASGS